MHFSHIATAANIETYADVTGVILAGGRSRRMGQDKATLEIAGKSMIDRILAMMAGLFPSLLIAGDRPDLVLPEVPSVPDIFPGSPLGGIHGGLSAAPTPWIFVMPCDLPFPDPDLVRFILRHREGYDIVLPRTPDGLEPIFALYHKNCLAAMAAMLVRGDCRIYDFYDQVRVCYLNAEILPAGWQRAFFNLNTPEDLRFINKEAL